MPQLITLPAQERPLPTPADLGRLLRCRYAVMVVAGRSGSGLIQAHLDGHRQVFHIPAIFKFHDFLAARGDRLLARAPELARAFVDYPAHAPLFDTRQSIHVAGQLGEAGDVAIVIDRCMFQSAMVSALGSLPAEPRRALYAAVLAYEWCLGRRAAEARVVFHHLHHGDWLWPELLIDKYNLGGLAPMPALRASLKPDLLLISLRAPHDVLRSYPSLTAAVTDSGAERVDYYERLLRLLAQDWLRARVAAGSDIPTFGIRLEDMKADLAGTLSSLCEQLDVDASDPALLRTTYYGHAWTEDTWSVARKSRPPPPQLDRDVCWQDEVFVMGGLAGLTDGAYPADVAFADWNGVLDRLVKAADEPPVTVFPDPQATASAPTAAADRMWDRIGFLERFRSLAAAQRLGPLNLCRRAGA